MSDDTTLLREIANLRSDILDKINGRFSAVNQTLTRLDQQYTKAELQQERRNSEFADRNRVEVIAELAAHNTNTIAALGLRLSTLEQDKRDQQNELRFPLRVALTAVLLSVTISSSVAILLHFVH
jgi:hypothetical protein